MSITLAELVEAARGATDRRRWRLPESRLEERLRRDGAFGRRPGRLREALSVDGLSVIAEVKGASPLSGPTREEFEPLTIARGYAEAGAAAVSVLTEERHFRGRLQHLEAVAAGIDLPVLRKDFIVERYQVLEAAAGGAAAVLLIAEVLEPSLLRDLVSAAREVGLDALVEVHDEESLAAALASGSGLVGINNRDLRSMRVDLDHCLRMAGRLPEDWVRVAESGVRRRDDLERIAAAGYDAALVGSSLMGAPDPGRALASLLGEDRP